MLQAPVIAATSASNPSKQPVSAEHQEESSRITHSFPLSLWYSLGISKKRFANTKKKQKMDLHLLTRTLRKEVFIWFWFLCWRPIHSMRKSGDGWRGNEWSPPWFGLWTPRTELGRGLVFPQGSAYFPHKFLVSRCLNTAPMGEPWQEVVTVAATCGRGPAGSAASPCTSVTCELGIALEKKVLRSVTQKPSLLESIIIVSTWLKLTNSLMKLVEICYWFRAGNPWQYLC